MGWNDLICDPLHGNICTIVYIKSWEHQKQKKEKSEWFMPGPNFSRTEAAQTQHPLTGKTQLFSLILITIRTKLCLYFGDRRTAIDRYGYRTKEEREKHNDCVVFPPFPSHWITSLVPPLRLPGTFYPSSPPPQSLKAGTLLARDGQCLPRPW